MEKNWDEMISKVVNHKQKFVDGKLSLKGHAEVTNACISFAVKNCLIVVFYPSLRLSQLQ